MPTEINGTRDHHKQLNCTQDTILCRDCPADLSFDGMDKPNLTEKDSGSEVSGDNIAVPAFSGCDSPDSEPSDSHNQVYNMHHPHRGRFLIICNRNFQDHARRTGSQADVRNLTEAFSALRFRVDVLFDRTAVGMYAAIEDVCRMDHTESDCFGCAILSHGERDMICGTDREISVDTLVDPLRKCTSLQGKPKLIFMQACRGTWEDHGYDVTDSADDTDSIRHVRLPVEADFLFMYSTVPGYKAFRDIREGSWFILALCHVLRRDAKKPCLELQHLLTRVNYHLAYNYHAVDTQTAPINHIKQMCSVVSQLTKLVYLMPQQTEL